MGEEKNQINQAKAESRAIPASVPAGERRPSTRMGWDRRDHGSLQGWGWQPALGVQITPNLQRRDKSGHKSSSWSPGLCLCLVCVLIKPNIAAAALRTGRGAQRQSYFTCEELLNSHLEQ